MQGAVNPDEFYVHKPMLEKGRPAIVRRSLGSKLQKMVFGKSDKAGKSTRVVDVDEAERNAFSLNDKEILELAKLRGRDRAPLRPADGHRVGARTAPTAASTCCRRGPRRSSPAPATSRSATR